MKKAIKSLLLLILFLAAFMFRSFAEGEVYYIYDDTGSLAESEMAELDKVALEIKNQYGMAVAYVLSSNCKEGDTIEYAEHCYAEGNWGKDALLLVINEEGEEYYFLQEGKAETLFTEKDLEKIWEAYEEEELYYNGVEKYLLGVGKVLEGKSTITPLLPSGTKTSPSSEKQQIPQERQQERLVDEASLLNKEEQKSLLEKLNTISEKQNFDVAIVTVASLEGKTATEFADDFYDYNGYGMGKEDDGILFLISMEDRDWAISTHAYGITAFTDAGQKYIMDEVRPLLSNGDYSLAFDTFASLCDDFVTQAKTGAPYDTDNLPRGKVSDFWIFGNLGIGGLLSFFIMRKMKSPLRSVSKKQDAAGYVSLRGIQLTKKEDVFLSRNVIKTVEFKEGDSSSGGSGSSTHTSSSGRTHGGSSGKF